MLYYRDPYWRIWVRRLLILHNTGQRLDISLTGEDAGEERIRVHTTPDTAIEKVTSLPDQVETDMIEKLGVVVANRLIRFNYVRELGLANIIAADKANVRGGGVPVVQILAAKGFTVQGLPCGHAWTSHNKTLAQRQLAHTAIDALIVPSNECPLCGEDDEQRHYEYLQDLGEGMFDREAQ